MVRAHRGASGKKRRCRACRNRGVGQGRGRKLGLVGIEKTCKRCGTVYRGYAKGLTSCCTSCRRKGVTESTNGTKPVQRTTKKCHRCGSEFWGSIRRRYCSTKCHRAFRQEPTYDGTCFVCGKLFSRRMGAKFCSKACNSNHYGRIRRIRMTTSVATPVSFAEIFNRDLGICWICKKRVDRSKKAPHSKSPSLDHVIPLSKGGVEHYDNVALAHFGCNSAKNAKVLTLF